MVQKPMNTPLQPQKLPNVNPQPINSGQNLPYTGTPMPAPQNMVGGQQPNYAAQLNTVPQQQQPQQHQINRPQSTATIPSYQMAEIERKALAGEPLMNATPEKQSFYDNIQAQSKGYKSGDYQSHYGIGSAGNVSGGFDDWNNITNVNTELGRVQEVMGNREGYGLSNDPYQSYLNKLQSANKPYQTQVDNEAQARQDYDGSQAKADAAKWTNATIDDIAAKYGFDFSRDYAKQQAEAEAQALRNANQDAQRRNESNKKTGLASIDSGLMNQAESMDRSYFQQMMQQQQNQVGTGLNAGIASDQDLRLQMNRQAEMGSSHRDANLGRMKINENFNLDDLRLAEGMGLIDQQSLAREDSLYNDRLMDGFNMVGKERDFYTGLDQQHWGRSQAEIDRAMGQQNWIQNHGLQQSEFDWRQSTDQRDFDYGVGRDGVADQQWSDEFGRLQGRDKVQDQQWSTEFDRLLDRDKVGDNQWQQGHDYDKILGNHGMSIADQQIALQRQNASRAARGPSGPSGPSKAAPKPTANALKQTYDDWQRDTFEREKKIIKKSAALGILE